MENTTLLYLDLQHCDTSLSDAELLCAAFVGNITCSINLRNNPLPDHLQNNPRSFQFATTSKSNTMTNAKYKELSPDAMHIALKTSKQWIDERRVQVQRGRKASNIVASLTDDANYDREEDSNILPDIAVQRQFAANRDKNDLHVLEYEANKKIVMVGYGNEMQIIGHIEVLDSTNYEQAKILIRPLVKEYLAFSQADNINHLKENFTLLDNNKKQILGRDALVKTIWAEASLNENLVIIKPADWLILPDVDEEIGDINTQV
jgi:hypothetical protein